MLSLAHLGTRLFELPAQALIALDVADFDVIPTNKIPSEKAHFVSPHVLVAPSVGRPTRPAMLEANQPIPWYQPRTGYAPLRSESRCRWAWWWRLLAIISLAFRDLRAPGFGKTCTNFGRGNYLNFCTSGFRRFVHDLEVWRSGTYSSQSELRSCTQLELPISRKWVANHFGNW